jgi:hypothetical protein
MNSRKTHINKKQRETDKAYFGFCLKKACAGCKHSILRSDSDTGVECTASLLKVCKPFTERNFYTKKETQNA